MGHPEFDVAIIGGGPAGLGIARLLSERGIKNTIVLEASDRVGGKSKSVKIDTGVAELGTCYLTPGYTLARRWMNELSITRTPVGRLKNEGIDFESFVRSGSGPPLSVQIVQYLTERSILLSRARSRHPPSRNNPASQSTAEWLANRNMWKLHRLMLRAITSLGYGLLDDVSIYQTMLWLDFDTVYAGVYSKLEMPKPGWSAYWDAIAANLNVRTNSAVIECSRTPEGASILTVGGSVHTARFIVVTIPMDQWVTLCAPSKSELDVADGVEWLGYTTTLISADKWFDDSKIRLFLSELAHRQPFGRVISARRELESPDFGGTLYVTGQLPGQYSSSELRTTLLESTRNAGAVNPRVIDSITWQYFPQIKRTAIQQDLIPTMLEMQGSEGTFYTGATFSHESVRGIDRHNAWLTPKILRALNSQATRVSLPRMESSTTHLTTLP